MAALTAPLENTPRLGGDDLWKLPLAASAKIWAGGIVMIDAGYAKPGAVAVGKFVAGRAERSVDNTGGSAGAKVLEVRRGIFKYKCGTSTDAITQADVGNACYVLDDQTVAKTDGSGARSKAGLIYQIDPDGGVWVEIGRGTV